MPETYGVPEPEPTRTERIEGVVTQAIAGQSVVRRVVLYVLVILVAIAPAPVPDGLVAIPLLLLMATDEGLA